MKKIIFYACMLLISISASAQVPSYVPTNGLVAYYPFSGNASDASGNGNNAIVNGATLTNDKFGKSNSAYNFDGINDYLSVNHSSLLNLPGTGSFTLSSWINPIEITNEYNIISKGAGHGNNSNDVYILSVYFSKIGLELAAYPTAIWTKSDASVTANSWSLVTVVYDNTINASKFYLNGNLVGQKNCTITPSSNGDTNPFFIGKQGYSCDCNYFKGSIDEVGIWNRALTQQEITNLYSQNQTAQLPSFVPINGLVAYYPFDGNALDASGNGNNGIVNGATLTNDKFGKSNAAYGFDGINDYLSVNHNSILNLPGAGSFTFTSWINPTEIINEYNIISKGAGHGNNSNDAYILSVYFSKVGLELAKYPTAIWTKSDASVTVNAWNLVTVVYDNTINAAKYYLNGNLVGQKNYTITPSSNGDTNPMFIGKQGYSCDCNYFKGKIDEIGIWNRALTQEEITNLYNANLCIETISVTDTLVINVNRTGYNPISYSNTIKVYPNPAKNKITIDNGDIQKMNGYSIKIINSLGQQVYQGGITQQIVSIDITQWTGNGMYYLQLTDNNGNIVDVKKIVLQ